MFSVKNLVLRILFTSRQKVHTVVMHALSNSWGKFTFSLFICFSLHHKTPPLQRGADKKNARLTLLESVYTVVRVSSALPLKGSDLAEDIERKAHNFLSDVQVKRKPPVQEVTLL